MDEAVEEIFGSVHGVNSGLFIPLGKEVGNGIPLLSLCDGGNHINPLNGIALRSITESIYLVNKFMVTRFNDYFQLFL